MLSILLVRIALAIGCVFHSTSIASSRFAPRSMPGKSRWLTIARRLIASCAANSLLRVLREEIGEARDRPLRVAGVQRGEDEVAGLRGGERHLRRVAIADFADQDHIRVLPQAVLQAVGEGQHVDADFALRDDRVRACAGTGTRPVPRP